MANTKPFVTVACICEQVLEEPDGVMSAIRIVDTVTIGPPMPPDFVLPQSGIQGVVTVKGLIALKSGDVVGNGKVELVMHSSTGEVVTLSPEDGWPVVMKGGEHGFQIKINFVLGVKNFGLIWFDVTWNGEVLTRFPLKLQQGALPEKTSAPN